MTFSTSCDPQWCSLGVLVALNIARLTAPSDALPTCPEHELRVVLLLIESLWIILILQVGEALSATDPKISSSSCFALPLSILNQPGLFYQGA